MQAEPLQANPLDDLNKELALLLKQRALAIERCEFAKAKAIDCHTDRLREQIESVKAKTNQIHSNLAFERKKEEVKMEANKALNYASDTIFQIKQEFQERLITLHQKHTDQAEQLAIEYAAELEVAATRSNPESRFLLNQAKFNAKNRNYFAAEQLYNESNQARNVVSEKRQIEVHDKYDTFKVQIEKSHEREVATCKEKESQKIITNIENFKKYIAKCKRFLVKSATDLGIQITPQDTAFLDEICMEINKFEIPQPNTPAKSASKLSGTTTPRSGRKGNATPKSLTRNTRVGISPRTLDTRFNGSIRSTSRLSTPRK
ncbi:hypothetical protein TRFO_18156 [Tritrichomonas foetus]|uniref:Uncharacterized protein n=1 Tax=Tritrichomonas foetus TaxID=1144522 RepID=A0A1J4KLZ9_9EUKA|nr:hypothetical protein TRFO_18156 [Tritrichomonas foetus]|eukprot:OHT12162.1 hypothetical protein TRFO_18156 [Tritrichomonas foetus]